MNNTTKAEYLLSEMKRRNGMTHKDIVGFLLDMKHGFGKVPYERDEHRGYWSQSLYGTRTTYGLLERFCENRNGKWYVVRTVAAPYFKQRRY